MTFEELDQLRAWTKGLELTPSDPVLRQQQARQVGRQVNDYCSKLPLLREYLQYRMSSGVGGRAFNTAGWHARGEQVLIAGLFSGAAMGPERWPKGFCPVVFGIEDNETLIEPRAVHVALRMLFATPYLWSHEVVAAILASPPLPPHIISRRLLPHPHMFWSLETAYPLTSTPKVAVPTGGGSLNWLLVWDQGESFAVMYDCTPPDATTYHVHGGSYPYGTQYPNQDGQPGTLWDLVLRFCSFLHSPYVRSDAQLVERPIRRRCARVNEQEANRPVHVVTLRRPTTTPTTPQDTVQHHEWKHQWWVSGHHRAQWFASEKAHRVIWIAPYLKGPTDKPVLQKVYAVKR